ncbi:hypothetical protein EDD37DRAFT_617446 [Exophiala viscosa]|uniref:uncharacterized protein n=1 Tax=Exophiala viscosa TaxID=2486360 RepID=UPI00219C339F|nr:hypothetical protein EDD37DRAFT_617446 [Exophiala viscosa]
MSVIGISPTDIITVVKAFKDAATALTPGPDGARQQFHDAQAALSSLELMVAGLKGSIPPASSAATVYNDLLERERRFQVSLEPYGKRLGPKCGTKSWIAIKRKLQYAFSGAQKVQEHIISTKPGVDAALFHTLGAQNDLAIKHHEQTVQTMRQSTTSVTDKIDALGPDMMSRLSQVISPFPPQHSDIIKGAIASHLEDVKLDLSQIKQALLPSSGRDSIMETDTSQFPTDAQSASGYEEATQNMGSEAYATKQRPCQHLRSPSRSRDQHALPRRLESSASTNASRLMLCLFSVSAAALYQNPATRKALVCCLHAYHHDPMSLTLLLLTIMSFANCFISLPYQVSLLTDESILLTTALGEPLKVPRHYWESFDIFHAFLRTHFETRPGKTYVRARRYRILLGGNTGQVLEIAKWQQVVSARMKLVMAMLLESMDDDCPKCQHPLERRSASLSYCADCDNWYQAIDMTQDKGGFHDSDSGSLDDTSGSSHPLSPSQSLEHLFFRFGPHPDELRYFVHMLLAKDTEPAWGQFDDKMTMEEAELGDVLLDTQKGLTCNRIWSVKSVFGRPNFAKPRFRDRLRSMEKFLNGEIDIDNLCTELRAVARCSQGGAVVHKDDVDRILASA